MRHVHSFLPAALLLAATTTHAQTVDYSVVSVPEESGIDFQQVTTNSDYVCMPTVRRSTAGLNWLSNRILDISIDGAFLAYLSYRNNTTNIFIKDISRQGSSVQRTNRQAVLDFSFSPDGKNICFSETRGKTNQIFQTSATAGYVCRQITSAAMDYSPVYSSDISQIFFARQEQNGTSIWGYNIKNNFLSTYSIGMNPCPIPKQEAYYCSRIGGNGKTEIWKVDYASGVEECIVSDVNRSFSTPSLSPDGQWLLFVGESIIETERIRYRNTDIFVCRTDGTALAQLTYHAADDLSPIWSRDGRYIFFISQRGSANATANVWRMNFVY